MPPSRLAGHGLGRNLCTHSWARDFSPLLGQPQPATAAFALRDAPRNNTSGAYHRPIGCLREYNTSSDPPSSSPAPSFSPWSPAYPKPLSFGRNGPQSASQDGQIKPQLTQMPTNLLYEQIRAEGAKGRFDAIINICRILVKDRGELPNRDMYTAILHSFVSSTNGTAGKVRHVLEEMGFWNDSYSIRSGRPKIELDARGCECVLEVLAVHPDHLLRTDILEYMKSRWYNPSDRAMNFVIAGMLRERLFEHALEMLEDMVSRKARVEDWLFDKAMWILVEFDEIEEAFHVLSLKQGVESAKHGGAATVNLSDALWGTLLDAAAQKQLHEEVNMVWNMQVQPGYLKPATGTCNYVLMLAAQHGDVPLATDVFRLLTERETAFTTHHYELLITAYLKADDLQAALSVVLIMAQSNQKVTAGTCTPFLLYMSKERKDGSESVSRAMRAFSVLQDYEATGRKIPTAVVNVCIKASISQGRFEEAIDIYKALHTVSQAGPNTETFNELLRGCHLTARHELAMFLVHEMIQLNLKPDGVTYDRIITVCLEADNLDDALLYYEEMMLAYTRAGTTQKKKVRRSTWELLIQKCISNGDERAVALLRDYNEHVDSPDKGIERAVSARFQFGTAREDAGGQIHDSMMDDISSDSRQAAFQAPIELVAGVAPKDTQTGTAPTTMPNSQTQS